MIERWNEMLVIDTPPLEIKECDTDMEPVFNVYCIIQYCRLRKTYTILYGDKMYSLHSCPNPRQQIFIHNRIFYSYLNAISFQTAVKIAS